MRTLLNIKYALMRFYSGLDAYLTAALKFAISFFTLYYLYSAMGYMEFAGQFFALLIVAAFCSFLPANALILASAVYLEVQLYGCSLEAAAVGAIVLLLALLLYFSFIPGQTYVVILTALCIAWKIPLAVPVVCGLLLGPGAVVGITFGTGVYYAVCGLVRRQEAPVGLGEELFNRILKLLQTLFLQPELVLSLVMLLAVFLVVWLIRRLQVRYSWTAAIISGVLVYGLLAGTGVLLLGTKPVIGMLLVDLLLGTLAGFAVHLFCFTPDYRKTQYLQFEDDEYYYYVKAVAKLGAKDEENGKEKETIDNE